MPLNLTRAVIDESDNKYDLEKLSMFQNMMMTAAEEDGNCDYGAPTMTHTMTVTKSDGNNKCHCKLFFLMLLLITITMVGIINVKFKYYS